MPPYAAGYAYKSRRTPWSTTFKPRDARIAGRARGSRSRVVGAARGFQRTAGYFGRYSGAAGTSGELKFHDLDVDDGLIATGGTIFAPGSVNEIAQGVTESTRIGRKCTIKSVNWRFNMSVGVTASGSATASDVVRVIMYLDKQCNGVTAATTDILQTNNYQSFNNLANKNRFRTLMDRSYTIEPQALGGNGTANDQAGYGQHDTFFLKCNIPIEYDDSASTGAIGTIRSNNIGVLILSQNGTVTFDSKMRLRFADGGA